MTLNRRFCTELNIFLIDCACAFTNVELKARSLESKKDKNANVPNRMHCRWIQIFFIRKYNSILSQKPVDMHEKVSVSFNSLLFCSSIAQNVFFLSFHSKCTWRNTFHWEEIFGHCWASAMCPPACQPFARFHVFFSISTIFIAYQSTKYILLVVNNLKIDKLIVTDQNKFEVFTQLCWQFQWFHDVDCAHVMFVESNCFGCLRWAQSIRTLSAYTKNKNNNKNGPFFVNNCYKFVCHSIWLRTSVYSGVAILEVSSSLRALVTHTCRFIILPHVT